ncbi:hypothetical protein E2C01_041440 [Portunus trituberculatus]|uniref:Uncharacterized protein n=1 Tax=Portunus trituberculatus TaxID=210409 RepID=A0A5B7FQE8_PORTR|nr:hypothetical protein [Portunus trituberculatus]
MELVIWTTTHITFLVNTVIRMELPHTIHTPITSQMLKYSPSLGVLWFVYREVREAPPARPRHQASLPRGWVARSILFLCCIYLLI